MEKKESSFLSTTSREQPSFLSLLNPWFPISILWQYRGLLWQFAHRNFEMRHKGSILGMLWSILSPLATITIYIYVFGVVFKGHFRDSANETALDYAVGVCVGLAIFHVIAETMAIAPLTIAANPAYVKRVVFPLEILPAANVCVSVFHMLITLVIAIIGGYIGRHSVPIDVLFLPIVIFPVILLALGIAWLLAAVGVFFRDTNQLTPTFTIILMFASAIFYPASRIQSTPSVWAIMRFNPIIHAIEASRDILLWNQPASLSGLVFLYGAGAFMACFGFAVFTRLKPAFADVV